MKKDSKVILSTKNLFKQFGKVVALDCCDFEVEEGEIMGIIGDNGSGKSTLIKAITGAISADSGTINFYGKNINFKSPLEAKQMGIETVYQTLALVPALSIAENIFLGREIRKKFFLGNFFRLLDRKKMQKIAREKLLELGFMTIQKITQSIETLSGGQRQGVAIVRATIFSSKVIILDEPTSALGVRESRKILELIKNINKKGISIILISHNIPHVFEICNRIHIHRLGKRLCVINTKKTKMEDAVAYMTGAKIPKKTT